MIVDTIEERGMSYLDDKWADPTTCHFPLFDFITPMKLSHMYIVYIIILAGASGIMLGLFYRLSCLLYLLPYCYILLLQKNIWNNHSYLFGLFALLFTFTNAHHYWSLDGLIWPKIRNSHVPVWNYAIFRTQVFLVYFIAGIKKLDWDWINGQTTLRLSSHWVFMPFTYILSWENIDCWIVHRGGLVIDLLLGFLLCWHKSRPFGFVIGGSFHIMNSQIFPIGMFPYVMLLTMPLFSSPDWPKRLISHFPCYFQQLLPSSSLAQSSNLCLYDITELPNDQNRVPIRKISKKRKLDHEMKKKPKLRASHYVTISLMSLYIALQCFLPFSHFITKGYNNWTNGLYGYSWDMMIHVWNTQLAVITFVEADTGEIGYLKPESYLRGGRSDWTDHADMAKQYALCLRDRLRSEHNIHVSAIYFDIWKSLNGRFHQRIFNPSENILKADNWHPLHKTNWLMPLLADLSHWRQKMKDTFNEVVAKESRATVTFFADFPGLWLENYVQDDFGNTSLHVLHGRVNVQTGVGIQKNVTLNEGDIIQIPAGQFHTVYTVSDEPACYMYVYINTTEKNLYNEVTDYEKKKYSKNGHYSDQKDTARVKLYEELLEEKMRLEGQKNISIIDQLVTSFSDRYHVYKHTFHMAGQAIKSLLTGVPLEKIKNDEITDFYSDASHVEL